MSVRGEGERVGVGHWELGGPLCKSKQKAIKEVSKENIPPKRIRPSPALLFVFFLTSASFLSFLFEVSRSVRSDEEFALFPARKKNYRSI